MLTIEKPPSSGTVMSLLFYFYRLLRTTIKKRKRKNCVCADQTVRRSTAAETDKPLASAELKCSRDRKRERDRCIVTRVWLIGTLCDGI